MSIAASGKPITAILFDVDGTVYVQGRLRRIMLARLLWAGFKNPVDGWRNTRVISAYRNALETLRANPEPTDIESAQLQLAADRAGVSLDEASSVVRRWFGTEPLSVLHLCVYDGLVDFLARSSALSVRLAVVSDYEADQKLEALGIARYFSAVVTPRTTGRLKPHPEMLQTALDLLGADREQALYVGDRADVDVPAARNVGVRCAILGKRPVEGNVSCVQSYRQLADLIWPIRP